MNLREYGKHKRELAAIQKRLEKLETLEELEATVTAMHKKVHANTVQLEKIKERVGKERG